MSWLIVLAALVAVAVTGWPAATVFVPRLGALERAAVSLWLGFAGITLCLLLIGLLIDYSRLAAGMAWVVTFAAACAARLVIGPASSRDPSLERAALFSSRIERTVEWVALGLVAVVLAQLALIGVEAYLSTFDFFANWGLDTKIFFLRHAVDFHGLDLARAYYPAAAPLGHLWYDLWLGKLGDRYLSLPLAVEAAALVLLTRLLLVRLGVGRALAALLTFFLCAGSGAFLFSALSGYGDLPMAAGLSIAVGGAALWLRSAEDRWLAFSGLGAGLAVWSKFEGVPSVALIGLALLLVWFARGRRLSELRSLAVWWGLVLLFALPWYLLVWTRHLGVGHEHLAGFYVHPVWILGHVASALGQPGSWGVWWAGALALALATAPAWLRGPLWARWLGLVVAIELLAVLIAYVTTVHAGDAQDVAWTAPRLYFHWMPALVLVVGSGLQATLPRTGSRQR